MIYRLCVCLFISLVFFLSSSCFHPSNGAAFKPLNPHLLEVEYGWMNDVQDNWACYNANFLTSFIHSSTSFPFVSTCSLIEATIYNTRLVLSKIFICECVCVCVLWCWTGWCWWWCWTFYGLVGSCEASRGFYILHTMNLMHMSWHYLQQITHLQLQYSVYLIWIIQLWNLCCLYKYNKIMCRRAFLNTMLICQPNVQTDCCND